MGSDVCANVSGITDAEGVASISCLMPLFASIIKAIVAFGAVALFIMLIVSGFKLLSSGGDPKKLEEARGSITQAIVGIAIMSIAYLIILTIQTFTGVEITTFEFPVFN